MRCVVADTNVGIVANGDAPQADPRCVAATVRALVDIMDRGRVVIDDNYRILREYLTHHAPRDQRGAGNRFITWLLLNQANPDRCEQVHLTQQPGSETDFEEFPTDPELEKFDRSDRKFVAVARASANRPTVLNAVDTRSWPVYAECLARHGVHVECLCPHLTKP